MSPVSTPRDVKPVQAKAKEKTKLYGVDTEDMVGMPGASVSRNWLVASDGSRTFSNQHFRHAQKVQGEDTLHQ